MYLDKKKVLSYVLLSKIYYFTFIVDFPEEKPYFIHVTLTYISF